MSAKHEGKGEGGRGDGEKKWRENGAGAAVTVDGVVCAAVACLGPIQSVGAEAPFFTAIMQNNSALDAPRYANAKLPPVLSLARRSLKEESCHAKSS